MNHPLTPGRIHASPVTHPMPFIGRSNELAETTARLVDPDCRLLSVIGLGGSGKTRLAIEAAAAVAPHFLHGTAFVTLQPVSHSELLVPAIAQALGLTLGGDGDPQQLFDLLRDQTLLLILDSCEHMLDGAGFISSLLAAAPGVTVLTTSRVALGLREEWLYPLHGLAIPLSVYATALEEYEAVQLLLSHARRIQPEFDLIREHEAVIRICRMTAGLPLAINLAASWLRGFSATQIAHSMKHDLDFLATTARTVEERHRSMRAVFDQSWRLLPADERLLFARLSVFVGGFSSDAAVKVAGAALSSLAALVEKSLVQRTSADRFTIHALLRQYGSEQLDAAGETEAIEACRNRYFAQLRLEEAAALHQAPEAAGTVQAQFLTLRERQILDLLAVGMTNPEIASQLFIGTGTVKTHTLNIYRKLAVANRIQAIIRGQALGLLAA